MTFFKFRRIFGSTSEKQIIKMSFRIEKVSQIHVSRECCHRDRSRSPLPSNATGSGLASAMSISLLGGLQNLEGDWLIPARQFRLTEDWKNCPIKVTGVVFDSDGNRVEVESILRLTVRPSQGVNTS